MARRQGSGRRAPGRGQTTLPYLERAEVLEGRDRRIWKWIPLPSQILLDVDCSADITAVYAGLARHVQGRRTHLSVPRLQAYTGRSQKTVAAAITRLVDLGYVATEPRPGHTAMYELRELPDLAPTRLVLDASSDRWGHVRTPVVVLDDARTDALAYTVFAAAAWLAENDPTPEVRLDDLAVLAGLAVSRSGRRTVRARLEVLAGAGYLTFLDGRATVGIRWVPIPPVPEEHRISVPVDARPSRSRLTPASDARSFDTLLLDAADGPSASETGTQEPLRDDQADDSTAAERAPDAGVNPVGDDGERAPDAGQRAPATRDLDTPPSPFGREGGAGGQTDSGAAPRQRPDDVDDAVLDELLADAAAGLSAPELTQRVNAALGDDHPSLGRTLLVVLAARRARRTAEHTPPT